MTLDDSTIQHKVDLLQGEEVLLDTGPAVLTSQRILANWKGPNGGRPSDEALLQEIVKYQKVNGGQESRMKLGLQLGGGGIVLVLVEPVLTDLRELLGGLVFLAGALGIVFGVYLILMSLVRARPQTTVLFTTDLSGTIPVSFPGWDNPKADQLISGYERAKRAK